jgi:hypothetical protein
VQESADLEGLAATCIERKAPVFGLVGEYSGEPVIGRGLVTTPMKGILTPGHVVRREQGAMTLECMEYNVPDLPTSFGGTSGGGLWRTYLNDSSDGSYGHVETRLCGVATFQSDATHIVCQGIERIEQFLMPAIRRPCPALRSDT